MEVIRAMAQYGNPNSASDAGVGALCALTAVKGAFLNVRINSAGLKDKTFVEEMLVKGKSMVEAAESLQNEILQLVETHL